MGTVGGAATSSHLLTWDPGLEQAAALRGWGAQGFRLGTGNSSPLKLCLSLLVPHHISPSPSNPSPAPLHS